MGKINLLHLIIKHFCKVLVQRDRKPFLGFTQKLLLDYITPSLENEEKRTWFSLILLIFKCKGCAKIFPKSRKTQKTQESIKKTAIRRNK